MTNEIKKYYLVYQITNKLNNMIYIGCHVTENINDKYMGSGTNIRKAIKQYGLENFDKSILYCFDNLEDMFAKEKELVNNEFIAKDTNYNIIIGGGTFLTTDNITVKDKDGNTFNVHKTDPRYLSGELVGCTKGRINLRDKDGNNLQVDKDDHRYLSRELVGCTTGKVVVKDKDDNIFQVDKDDPRYLSGELVFINKNKILVKDKYNNNFWVDKNDEKYLSGELVGIWKDRKHKQETKEKIGLANSISQKGESNSQFGTCWITKDNKNKKIKKEELEYYLSLGWIKGRKIKKIKL